VARVSEISPAAGRTTNRKSRPATTPPAGQRAAEQHERDHDQQPLGLVDELVEAVMPGVLPLGQAVGAEAEGDAEHGQRKRQLAQRQRQPGDEQDARAGAREQQGAGMLARGNAGQATRSLACGPSRAGRGSGPGAARLPASPERVG
jgi:hypothetical protein